MKESELGVIAVGVVLVAASVRMWLFVRRVRARGELEDHRRSREPGSDPKRSKKDSSDTGGSGTSDSNSGEVRPGRPGRIRRSIPSIMGGVLQGLVVLLFAWLVAKVLLS